MLDLVSYLDRPRNIYRLIENTLLTSLQNCLQATSANVTSVCQSIIANQAKNAFEYYGSNGPGSDFFAQQNTLALRVYGTTAERSTSPRFRWTLSISTSCRHLQGWDSTFRLRVRQRS